MSVLQTHVQKHVSQFSPSVGDEQRVVKFGVDGEELIAFEPVDYQKIIESHGSVEMWSLDSLLKAGINPNSTVRTGYNSRLDGFEAISAIDAELEKSVVESKAVSADPESTE